MVNLSFIFRKLEKDKSKVTRRKEVKQQKSVKLKIGNEKRKIKETKKLILLKDQN